MTSVSEEIKKEFTLDEVEKHMKPDDCWLIIGNQSNGKPRRRQSWMHDTFFYAYMLFVSVVVR